MKQAIKLFFLSLMFISQNSLAMSEDKDAPVHIEADQVEIRDKEDLSTYRGNVKITKGSLKITGDKITIKSKNGNLFKIRITGKPATFYQLNDLKQVISAESKQMEYLAADGMLELKEEALLVKAQSNFSSDHIIYDTHKDIVKAGHHNNPDPVAPPRVKITIHPEKK